ncbi:hypothetical protein NL360_28595, partial [Klebsiella pneumoniae]|nr:hypothetical protein [Klebsiella pneumoniae]
IIAFGVSSSVAKAVLNGSSANFTTMFLVPVWEIILALGIGIALGFCLVFFLRHSHSEGNNLNLEIGIILVGIGLAIYF